MITDRIERKLLRHDGPLDCRQVGRVLQRYLDGEIDERIAARVAAHLDECDHCGLDAESFRELKTALGRRRTELPTASIDRLRDVGRRLAAGEFPDEAG